MLTIVEIMRKARAANIVIPAFNIPYLPMMEPVVQAVVEQNSFALVETARLEWLKFESKNAAAVAEEFNRWRNLEHVRLHLDHVPVIDEDNLRVDTLPIFKDALELGYESVMIDGSRLSFDDNVCATRQVVELAHAAGVPVEAELGAVLGHEDGPMPSYDELFASGRGFTDVKEAVTGCRWRLVTSTGRSRLGARIRRRSKPV
jgi:fructose-bisphosphate aldolase class II